MNTFHAMRKVISVLIFLSASHATSVHAADRNIETLIRDLGIHESPIASRNMPGWERPDKVSVVVWRDLPPTGFGSEKWFREVSDGVPIHFVYPSHDDADLGQLAGSDVFIGPCFADAIAASGKFDYIHVFSAGIDRCTSIPGLVKLKPIATNSAKASSETIAEHSIALLLALTRNLHFLQRAQAEQKWRDQDTGAPAAISVDGKTLLVLGLGGIGSQVARRANDLGMRVLATRNSSRNGPDYVDYVGLSDEMNTLASQADVVVNALPLTASTRNIVDAHFFAAMKPGSYYLSVGRGATTDTDALVAALVSGKLHGAGLDVTNPEPLPKDHPLWSLPNAIITPHVSASSDRSLRNTLMIARENLRRYIRGEKLLNLVDLKRGY